MDKKVNFPFCLYPGFPLHGYFETDVYRKEIALLFNTIKELQTSITKKKNPILHITIGAAMEEYTQDQEENSLKFQWQQLFPQHLQQASLSGNNDIVHLIISPNRSFIKSKFSASVESQSDVYKEPKFIAETKDRGWKQINEGHYIDKTGRVTVMIFCCPFPHIDPKNNKLLEKWKLKLPTGIDYDGFQQTNDDIDFVKLFYKELNQLMKVVSQTNGITTCFSFAVFNEYTQYSHVKNYIMFDEIKELFEDDYKTRLLAEWIYIPACYILHQYEKKRSKNYISYVEPVKTCRDGLLLSYDNGMIKLSACNSV